MSKSCEHCCAKEGTPHSRLCDLTREREKVMSYKCEGRGCRDGVHNQRCQNLNPGYGGSGKLGGIRSRPYSPSQYATIKEAIAFAMERHEGQLDKAGNDYYEHLLRVMLRCKTFEAKVVALLHDVVEDKMATLEEITTHFGGQYASWVHHLDRASTETEEEYYEIIKHDFILLEVKTADIDDNADPKRLALLDEQTELRLTHKYNKARRALGIIPDFRNDCGLVEGCIPAGKPCPFITRCNLSTDRCPTLTNLNNSDYSCGAARAFSISKREK